MANTPQPPADRVVLRSFSYAQRKASPQASFEIDCSPLPDPRYQKRLQGLTGKDDEVRRWMLDRDFFQGEKLAKELNSSAERIHRILRKHGVAMVDIGCQDGRQQSVAFAEMLEEELHRRSTREIHTSVLHEEFPLGPSEHDQRWEKLPSRERKLIPREFLNV